VRKSVQIIQQVYIKDSSGAQCLIRQASVRSRVEPTHFMSIS